MLGIVERAIAPEMLHFMVALRFGVSGLALVSLIWAISDVWQHLRGNGTRAPFLYYISKIVISTAILFYAPAAFIRLAILKLNPVLAASLTMTGLALTGVFFILMQTVKHIYAGESQRTAWLRTIPLVLGTLMLMGIGAVYSVRP